MRAPQRLLGLTASITLLAIIIGLPAALLTIGPSVLPEATPTAAQVWQTLTRPDDGTLALRMIKALGWLVWLVMTALIVSEVADRARGRGRRLAPVVLRGPQSAAHGLVGAALLLVIAAPSSGMAHAATAPTATTTLAAPTHTAAPAEAAVAVEDEVDTPATGTPTTTAHTVRVGESLWSIAEDHLGEGIRYGEIRDLNRDALGENPGFLHPGTVLQIPATSTEHSVTVQPGDTLSQIAASELGDADEYPRIAAANEQVKDPDTIYPGMTLTIPQPATATTPEQPQQPEQDAAATPPPSHPGSTSDPATHESATHEPGTTQTPPRTPPQAGREAAEVAAAAGGREDTQGGDVDASDGDESSHAWLLTGLTGGGAVLAGALLLQLRRRRSTQRRHRRAGRTIATPTPSLGPVEKSISAVGTSAAVDVERMDSALRRLATARAAQGVEMPAVAAVEITRTWLGLHLSQPSTLTGPWQGSDDQLHWYLPGEDGLLEEIGESQPDQPAPYPLLVTLGATDSGSTWLLNLEEQALSITGDTDRGRDTARYLAAELAVNPWSHGVRVDVVGVAEDVAAMGPDRIWTHTGAGPDPAAEVLADTVTMIDRAGEEGVDVATARASQAGSDTWHARLLLIDAATDRPAAMDDLLDLLATHPGRTGASVVVRGDDEAGAGLEVHVSAAGRITMPSVGLNLAAVGLTRDEARGCAGILTQGEQIQDVPVPVREDADEGWRSWTNEAGALREEYVLERSPRTPTTQDTSSLLDLADEEYLAAGATTTEDLQTLAPQVPQHVSQAVLDVDPHLEADLAAWWAPDCPLPRLTLLGPVSARTRGTPVTKRKGYYTEMLAYLATRATGATPGELAETFGITTAKTRDYVRIVRDWLGTNPVTGSAHLPDARHAPSAQVRGQNVYEVVDVLVDADLFRRLRARGEAQGPEGIEDLDAALRLVTGRPFDGLRPGGWHWLSEGDRLDQHMICAIVDVAHLVTTASLKAGDLKRARLAAETAALAAPDEEIPRLDLAAVAGAEGHASEADRILRDEVFNRSDDEGAPPDLPARTEQIVADKQWAQRARAS